MSSDIVLSTGEKPDAAVIWLHGLGADASDFPPTVPYLNLDKSLSIKFIFPNAPEVPVTVNGGWVMRSWYDILRMGADREINEKDLLASVARIDQMISSLSEEGISAERILLVGFSQGGAVVYEVALSSNQKMGGVAAMSTYLPRPLTRIAPKAAKSLPILMLHGEQDDVVYPDLGQRAVDQLLEAGYQPQTHWFPMGHEVSIESLAVLGRWITQQLTVPR